VEWLKPLLGQTVGLDTAPLFYFIEKHPLYFHLLQPFFEAVERGDIELVISTLTQARQYSSILLNAAHVTTLAVSPQIATEAARLRAIHGYKTPDAIQLATAESGHATFFVTNDEALIGTSGSQVVILKHLLAQP
jgi:predicted nucleic acid-binding protein